MEEEVDRPRDIGDLECEGPGVVGGNGSGLDRGQKEKSECLWVSYKNKVDWRNKPWVSCLISE